MFHKILVIASCLQLSWGHLLFPGKCPDLPVKQNFDVHKYMGTWYGQASFGTESTQGKGKCVTAIYTYNNTAKHVELYNWQIPSPGYRSSINGTSVPLDPTKNEGKLKVTFFIGENRTKTFPLLVLDTDYDKWAVVYYCKDLLQHHETSGWILTRTQDFDNQLDTEEKVRIGEKVLDVLNSRNVSLSIYTKTVQTGCTDTDTDMDTNNVE